MRPELGDQEMVGFLEVISQVTSLLNLLLACLSSTLEACASYLQGLRKRKRMLMDLQSSRARKRVCVGGNVLQKRWLKLAEVRFPKEQWTVDRSTDWWERFVLLVWSEDQWLCNFRMTRRTFMEIVSVLNVRMERQTTRMREPVPVEKRVAAALWYLANSISYRLVSQQFGIGISTMGEIVIEVCFALEVELYSKVVCLGPEIGKIMDGFGRLGFPHCIGAIDGTHVAIRAPKRRIKEYGNRKYYCSILLQGTVDHTGKFIDTEIGFSGRTNDAFVFNNSNLCATMDAGEFVPGNPTVTIQGVTVPAIIIADGAYPIRRWLMKAYQKPRSAVQKNFNLNLCRARNVVERAFGRLKARWRIISGRVNVFPENVSAVVTACVILHNICEERGHAVLQDLPEQPTIIVPDEEMADRNVCARTRAEGQCVRDALATYMYNHACRR